MVIPHTITASHLRDYPHAIANEDEDLFLEVKQYIPDRQISFAAGSGQGDKTINDDAVTIIAAGGIGFIKELYEPLFEELLLRAESAGFSIRAIWTADPVNTGASAVRNQANLGCDPSWWDHSRDLWAMINYFSEGNGATGYGIRPFHGSQSTVSCRQTLGVGPRRGAGHSSR